MDFQQVQIIVSIANNLSFTEASYETSFSLSSISKKVNAAEKELGIKLFERKGSSKVSLTSEGEALMPFFIKLANAEDELKIHVDNIINKTNSILTIACPNGLSTLGEDETIVKFISSHPKINVNLITAERESVFRLLEEDKADAVFTRLNNGDNYVTRNSENISYVKIGILTPMLMVAKNHPAIEGSSINLAKCKNDIFLFRSMRQFSPEKSSKSMQIVNACREEGFDPKTQFVDMRSSLVFEMAASGHGVVPLMYAPKTAHQNTVVLPLSKTYFTNILAICFKKNNRNTALKEFVSFVKK